MPSLTHYNGPTNKEKKQKMNVKMFIHNCKLNINLKNEMKDNIYFYIKLKNN